MELRDRLKSGVKAAMKAKDTARLSTLRLINAALKERDIVSRSEGRGDEVGEDEVLALLGKMVKQRQESARVYEEGGRIELAERELDEIKIIEDYLPRQLTEDETEAAIAEAEARLAGKGRLLIRKSGTEPLIRVMAEHEDAAVMQSAVDYVVEAVADAVGA